MTPLRTPRVPPTPRDNGENKMCFIDLIENNSRETGVALFNMLPPSLSIHRYGLVLTY